MKKIKLADLNKILVIQTAFLGDTALTIPLFKEIKNINSNIKISLITSPRGYGAVKDSIYIDEIIVFDKYHENKGINGIKKIVKLINQYKPDAIVSPHRSLRTSLIVALSKVKFKIGYSNSALNFVYNYKVHYFQNLHEIDRILYLLSVFEGYDFRAAYVPLASEFKFINSDLIFIERFINQHKLTEQKQLILIAPGSVWKTKMYPPDNYIELIKKFELPSFRCIIIGSKDEYQLCEQIASATNSINAAGQLNLPQLLILMSKSSLVITNDSAPTHLAGLVNCPVLTIYGPTDPIFGFYPRNNNGYYVKLEGLKCQPCRIHGSNKCPIGTHKCMKELSPEIILQKVKFILKNHTKFEKENEINPQTNE